MNWRRVLCALGLHYWRRVYRVWSQPCVSHRNGRVIRINLDGVFRPYRHRCKWCNKEKVI